MKHAHRNLSRPVLQAVAAGLLLLAVSAPTRAADGDWQLKVGLGRIDFREDVSLSVGGAPFPTGGASLSDDNTLIAEIGYRYNPQWSVWVTLGVPPTTDVRGTGDAAPFGKLGEVRYGPLALTGHYNFDTGSALRPYVGAGAVYFAVLDEKDGAIAGLEAKSRFGSVLQIGAEYALTPSLGIFVDVKKLFVKTRATGTLPGLGGASVEADIDLDPVVFTAGLVFDF